jgi:uncharacterized protein YjbJ (UPF0337 family)
MRGARLVGNTASRVCVEMRQRRMRASHGTTGTTNRRGVDMNKDIFKGQWKQLRGGVKKAWGNLTDDDLDRIDGDYDRFVGTVQERYGHAREDVERRIDEVFGGKT